MGRVLSIFVEGRNFCFREVALWECAGAIRFYKAQLQNIVDEPAPLLNQRESPPGQVPGGLCLRGVTFYRGQELS